MSWFVAFPITPVGWFDALEPPAGLKCEFKVDLHLTIAFFGNIEESKARAAFALTRDWPKGPASSTVRRLAPLGNPRHPSVIAATLDDPALIALMRDRRDALYDAAGVERDTRNPLPHITVARFGRKASKAERAAGLAWANTTKLVSATVSIDLVALYRPAVAGAPHAYEESPVFGLSRSVGSGVSGAKPLTMNRKYDYSR